MFVSKSLSTLSKISLQSCLRHLCRLRQCLLTPREKAERAAPIDLASLDSSPPNRYLIASMGLQLLWSFGLACLDAYALKKRRDLQNPILVSLFVVGDWVTAMLTLAVACSSAGVIVLYAKDLNYCNQIQLPCGKFEISVVLAFIAWILIAISSHVMFWILASV